MKDDMEKLLSDAFYAPEPKNKQAFLKNIRPREISTFEMILQQFSYIRFSVWLYVLGLIVVVVSGALLQFEAIRILFTIMMSFTAVITVLETRRSKKFGMSELEMATRYSLKSLVIARMLIVGMVSLAALFISSPIMAISFHEDVIITTMRTMIPYLVTLFVSLRFERSVLGRSTEYGSLVIGFAVSAAMIFFHTNCREIIIGYIEMVEKWGVFIVVLLIALTVSEQWKTVKNVEEFA